MLVCRWEFQVPFGKQGEAISIAKEWSAAMAEDDEVPGISAFRVVVGHIGPSPARVAVEWDVATLTDWERGMEAVGKDRYQAWSKKLAPLVVPGSQRWEVWRKVD